MQSFIKNSVLPIVLCSDLNDVTLGLNKVTIPDVSGFSLLLGVTSGTSQNAIEATIQNGPRGSGKSHIWLLASSKIKEIPPHWI